MIYLKFEQIDEFKTTALPMYDYDDVLLLAQDFPYTKTIIEKLKEKGFKGAFVSDNISNEIKLKFPETSFYEKGMECMQVLNIDGCRKAAAQMTEEVLKHNHEVLKIFDLKKFNVYIQSHEFNVAIISAIIGMGLGLSEADTRDLIIAALLHDVGKLEIPETIINKPGRLTKDEYETIKLHSKMSYEKVKNLWVLSHNAKMAILHHHENEDGSGYPFGLKGKEISLFAKILHVADVYDALTSERSYKNPVSSIDAVEYIMGGCGSLFDKDVVQTLIKYVPIYPSGTIVTLNDGRVATVFDNSKNHNLRPVIQLEDGELIDLFDPKNFQISIKSPFDKTVYEDTETNSKLTEDSKDDLVSYFPKLSETRSEPKKILAVDDDVMNLKLVKKILKDDYEVICSTSGQQTLEYLELNGIPDLILMDIEMPNMNGIETVNHIKRKYGNVVPILYVSAVADKDTVLTCQRQGVAGYVLKPYKPTVIKSKIFDVLNY